MNKDDFWKRVFIVGEYNGISTDAMWKWKYRKRIPKAYKYMLVHTAIEAGVKLTIKELG